MRDRFRFFSPRITPLISKVRHILSRPLSGFSFPLYTCTLLIPVIHPKAIGSRTRARKCVFFPPSNKDRSLSVFRSKKNPQNLSSLLHLSSPLFFSRSHARCCEMHTSFSRIYEGEDGRYISLRVVFSARCFCDEKFIVRLRVYICTHGVLFFFIQLMHFFRHIFPLLSARYFLSLSFGEIFLYISADSLIIALL